MKTLKDVRVGETVTVAKLHGEGPVKRRTVTPGQLPTYWLEPVRALNSVVLPQLGLPARAILMFKRCQSGRNRDCGEAPRRRPGEAPDHGYGHHQGRGDFCPQGGPPGRPHGSSRV